MVVTTDEWTAAETVDDLVGWRAELWAGWMVET